MTPQPHTPAVVQTDTIEAHLRTLVAHRTVSGDKAANNAALAYVADFLQRRGLYVADYMHEGFGSLVATTRPGWKRPRVLLYCHLDVAPAAEPLWQLQQRAGRYYGRGVFDMKFALAVYMVLVGELVGELAAYDFGIMVTTDEEVGGEHGAGYLARLGYRPEVCIMPDGGKNWGIETFAKGYMQLVVQTSGVSTHGSRPWEGENAISRLLTVVRDIEALFTAGNHPDASTCSVGYIRGGHTINHVPDQAECGIDIRFVTAVEEVLLTKQLRAICGAHQARLEVCATGPAVRTELDHPAVQAFCQAAAAVIGRRLQPCTAYGASDAGFFAQHGTACIVSAPPAGGSHSDGEWIDVAGVAQYKEVIKRYLQSMARHTLAKLGRAPAFR